MTPVQEAAFRDILLATVPHFEARERERQGGDPTRVVDPVDLDIGSYQNTVANYSDAAVQWVYLNMYLAKHVGCWRWFRRRTPVGAGAPVVSVGAGPNCCLWGWFLDHPPDGGPIHAVDPLPWSGVLDDPAAQVVNDSILGPGHPRRHALFVPPGVVPSQLAGLGGLSALDAGGVPAGSAVLVPFVLNHLIGGVGHIGDISPVVAWLKGLQRAASRVIVVDLPASRAVKFWPGLLEQLGFAAGTNPPEISFRAEAADIAALYPDRFGWPRRRAHARMTTASALVWTGTTWWTVDQTWPAGVTWG